MTTETPMTFRRYGRSQHLRIATAEDLRRAGELDEAHWVATSAPISTLSADGTFLECVDADHNGRIMCWELRTAIQWLFEVLADVPGVTEHSCRLRPAAVNAACPTGEHILTAVGKILDKFGRGDDEAVTLAEVRQVKAEVAAMPVSEAGVVLPAAAGDEQTRQFLTDVVAATGGAPHPGGAMGVAEEQLAAFEAEAKAYLEWRRRGDAAGPDSSEIFPLGGGTAEAYAIVETLQGKLEQYFAQCRAVALDGQLASRMGWTDEQLAELDLKDPAAIEQVLAEAPIARPRPDGALRLGEAINPADAERLEQLRRRVLPAALGESPAALTAEQWRRVREFFAGHEAWLRARPSSNITALDPQTLQAYQEGRFAEAVRDLIADSKQTAFQLDNLRLAEKLILYQAGLMALANNFVSFPDLYNPARRAMFEMGSLVMDGRRFNLAVWVADRAEHAKVAAGSNMYLMYVQVTLRDGEAPFELAVPVTSGSKGNLCVGKRGIFNDLEEKECDARVVQIIENPISVAEALVSPFVRLGRLLTGKIESITTKAEKKLDTKAGGAMAQVADKPSAEKSSMASAGMLAGAGLAAAALGSALAYMTETLTKLQWWEICVGIGGAVLAVLLPTAIIAWLKLRRRDLSAILEGSGWAINGRMRLTRRQRRLFTQRPRRPHAEGRLRRWWPWVVLAALLAAILGGLAYRGG